MLVSTQIWAMPSNFLLVPLHGLVVGTRGSLGRNYLCRIPNDGTPGHYTVPEPTGFLNWGVAGKGTPQFRELVGSEAV